MIGMIIFITFSLIGLALLIWLSRQYNESNGLAWAMILLICVSVFSGRWHRHFELHKYQVEFNKTLNNVSNDNKKLSKQISEYKHHNNGTTGFLMFKHKFRSNSNLGYAQDQALRSDRKLLNFPVKSAVDSQSDSKQRQIVSKNIIKQLQRHKYVGNGYHDDSLLHH